MRKILIIDDEVNIGLLLSKFLSRNGFSVSTSTTGNSAMERLSKESYDLVLCDYRLDDTDGREMLIKIKESYPKTGVIIITGYSDIKLAVELIKLGAYDYITKPLYPDEILNTINKAIETQYALNESRPSHPEVEDVKEKTIKQTLVSDGSFIIGQSSASRELMKQILLVAPTSYSVILTGESGTGKESVALAIHLNSPRKDQPFVAMDCGSLTKELAGSEFFGHEKGSFTGALYTKIGHFEMANGGTLFLDEVGNLSYEIQAALLRTVQERKIKRIGSTKEMELDVRIIVATNENLNTAMQNGKFREDLYHRFNEFSIHLPPLNQREKDILVFARTFLEIANKELHKNVTGFSAEVEDCFLTYNWPGNVRELKNVVRRATLLTEGQEIQLKALPLEISTYAKASAMEQSFNRSEKPKDLKNAALEAEYDTILKVLREVNFNKTKAAKMLNIDRKTLNNITLVIIIALGGLIAYSLQGIFGSILSTLVMYTILRPGFIYLVTKGWNKRLAAVLLLLVSVLEHLYGQDVLLKLKNMFQVSANIQKLIEDGLHKAGDWATELFPSLISGAFNIIFGLLLMYFLLYFMLLEHEKFEAALVKYAPFRSQNVYRFGQEMRNTTYANVVGQGLICLVQGSLLGLSFWILGYNDPLFWGVITAFICFVPVLGPPIVFVPAALLQLANGHSFAGWAMLIFGFVVIINIDNVLRFMIAKKVGNIHPVVTVIGVVIGVPLFGILGLVFGPLLISYFMLLIKIYETSALAADRMERIKTIPPKQGF
eukprot:gene11333-13215_t